VAEKASCFYYLFIRHIKKLHNEVGLDGKVYSMQGKAALTTVMMFKSLVNNCLLFYSQ